MVIIASFIKAVSHRPGLGRNETTGKVELRLSGLADPKQRAEALGILRTAVEDIRRLISTQTRTVTDSLDERGDNDQE